MHDARSSQRQHVNWRGAVKLGEGNIVAMKVLNISENTVQILLPELLTEQRSYPVMLEVPDRRDTAQRTQIVCKGLCLYSILSGSDYRVSMKVSDIPPQQQELMRAWLR